jgi:hypothetical protein
MEIFKTRTFTWREVALLKAGLISLGILCALYFYDYVIGLMWLWWVVFVVAATYFLARFFRGE